MTLPPSYFDEVYRAAPDPWGFEDRWYERRKRALTLAALPEPSYVRAFEPGCSIGVLTAELASRCDSLLATDVSPAALRTAQERLAPHPHVQLEQGALPAWPAGRFDLVVLSEVLYYLAEDDLARVARSAVESLAPGGTLLSVHWRHEVTDYPQSGDAVQAAVHDAARRTLTRTVEHVEADLGLSVHVRPREGEDAQRLSVAARDGLC